VCEHETAADRVSRVTEHRVQYILHHGQRAPLSPEEFVDVINYPDNVAHQKMEDIAFVRIFRGYWTSAEESWVCDTFRHSMVVLTVKFSVNCWPPLVTL